ncbi:hypothetical protein [Sulfurospirillum sp. 1612]|uniref:hypothetical protein n=1 Tax=Sulfurospirillum sp. 1612 TaxID=3094835 RepID=UPI002F93FF4C
MQKEKLQKARIAELERELERKRTASLSLREKEEQLIDSLCLPRQLEKITSKIWSIAKFLSFVITVVDPRYKKYLFYVKDENRVYIGKDLLKYKIMQIDGVWSDDETVVRLLQQIVNTARLVSGNSIILDRFENLNFKILNKGKEEKYNGDFTFISLKNFDVKVEIDALNEAVAVGTWDDDEEVLNSEYLKILK